MKRPGPSRTTLIPFLEYFLLLPSFSLISNLCLFFPLFLPKWRWVKLSCVDVNDAEGSSNSKLANGCHDNPSDSSS